jgi:hypothetical protein
VHDKITSIILGSFVKMDEEFLNINLNNATMHPNNHAL